MRRPARRTRLRLESLEDRTTPDGNSAGDLGIQANKLWDLGLTGQGIFIGQVEPERAAAKTVNGQAFDPTYHPDVQPEGVYDIDKPATKGAGYDWHAVGMAGVMVSRSADAAKKGIAFDAKLLSTGARYGTDPTRHPRAFQHVARQNQGANQIGVPAINLSYTFFVKGDMMDGSTLASKAVDYFSHKHDTLFVIAPHNAKANEHVPADAFNGLTVARAKQLGSTKPFTQAASGFPIVGSGQRRLGGKKVSGPVFSLEARRVLTQFWHLFCPSRNQGCFQLIKTPDPLPTPFSTP